MEDRRKAYDPIDQQEDRVCEIRQPAAQEARKYAECGVIEIEGRFLTEQQERQLDE